MHHKCWLGHGAERVAGAGPCSSSGASPPGPATLLPLFGSQAEISKESKDISAEFRQGYNWERKAHCK